MTQEQRRHPRIDDRNMVAITVLAAPKQTDLLGRTFFSLSHDVSAGGLSFSSQTEPAVGTKLRLAVVFSPPIRPVKDLAGRVASVRRAPKGGRYVVGVDLSDTEAARLNEWKVTVARRMFIRERPRTRKLRSVRPAR